MRIFESGNAHANVAVSCQRLPGVINLGPLTSSAHDDGALLPRETIGRLPLGRGGLALVEAWLMGHAARSAGCHGCRDRTQRRDAAGARRGRGCHNLFD